MHYIFIISNYLSFCIVICSILTGKRTYYNQYKNSLKISRMSELKKRKEAFVSDLTGGTIEEISIILSVAVAIYLSWNLLHYQKSHKNVQLEIFIDIFLNWCCPLLSITTYADAPISLNILIIFPCICYFILHRDNAERKNSEVCGKLQSKISLVKRPFITAYRGNMLILTSLSILAVDFPIFPRRFAKVETWGTSLMDLGVGSFVFSNGLVSSRELLKEDLSKTKISSFARMLRALTSSTTLLSLGLLRFCFVKNLEYQEHVTEYGVHWNFFITLALLPLFMAIIEPLSHYVPRVVIALVISLIYEYFLIYKDGVIEFLILAPRDNIFYANREGIISFFGYCSIFLLGQTIGFCFLGNQITKNNLYKPSTKLITSKSKLSTWDRLTSVSPLGGLLLWSFILSLFSQLIFKYHPFDVSRRFANLPYVIWVASFNTGTLAAYCIVDKLFGNTPGNYRLPITLEAMNSNGLLLFLLSNLITGLVNIFVSTLDTSLITSFGILLLYSLLLAIISITLLKMKIFIKL